jgi:hypothetical protein
MTHQRGKLHGEQHLDHGQRVRVLFHLGRWLLTRVKSVRLREVGQLLLHPASKLRASCNPSKLLANG